MSFIRSTGARRFAVAMGFALLVFGSSGCGSGQGDVSGKVTLDGKPLKWGTVLIEGPDGSAKQGNIDSNGEYAIRGISAGDAKVAVNSPDPKSVTSPKGGKATSFPDVSDWFPIPKQYEGLATSGLKFGIKGGKNTINIELKSE